MKAPIPIAATAFACGLLASCTLDGLPPLVVDEVSPDTVMNDAPAMLRISGGGFWEKGRADLDAAGASANGDGFRISLHGSAGEIALSEVRRHDEHTLYATLAAGVAPGRWSLEVVDPRGRHASLANALDVVAHCTIDADCEDGDPCTTSERCTAEGCKAGSRDLDLDGDGFVAASCGGEDCDDEPSACGAACNPNVLEGPAGMASCSDAADNDCDGAIDLLDATCTVGCYPAILEPPDTAVADATISTSPRAPSGAGVLRVARDQGDASRALLRFDVSSVPLGSVVVKAKLKLRRSSGGNGEVAVHEMEGAWSPSSVTWTESAAGTPWLAPGADFAEPSCDVSAVQSENTAWNVSTPVAAWVSGARANHGLLLLADPAGPSDVNIAFETASDENPPRITLDYCAP
jgi:hypothetical protein